MIFLKVFINIRKEEKKNYISLDFAKLLRFILHTKHVL